QASTRTCRQTAARPLSRTTWLETDSTRSLSCPSTCLVSRRRRPHRETLTRPRCLCLLLAALATAVTRTRTRANAYVQGKFRVKSRFVTRSAPHQMGVLFGNRLSGWSGWRGSNPHSQLGRLEL